ncbi:MAG: VOC family protein [Thermoanaerobaculia bacterium]|nr:VOC family protein [Thermoanaerobaculia bacterium]
MNPTKRQRIYPALRYADAHAAIQFLEAAFGFTRGAVYDGPGQTVGHAELHLGTATIGLNSATAPVEDNPWTRVRGGAYVALADAESVAARHAQAMAAGIRIARPLGVTDYGSHDFAAWDAEGHLWGFGTYAYSPAGEPGLSVALAYRDPRAAIAHLIGAFGFTLGTVTSAADGTLLQAELHHGDDVLVVGSEVACGPWGTERQATYLRVADPETHFARAKNAGATIITPPAEAGHGERGYLARDPEGFLWHFGTARPVLDL